MPIYIEVSRLHASVTIVARGKISPDEIRGAAQQLFDAGVPEFARLVDVSAASTDVNPQQIESIAALLRGRPDQKRGPVAFLIDAARGEFARAFKATQGDRPVSLFTSLHEARLVGARRRAGAGRPRPSRAGSRRAIVRSAAPARAFPRNRRRNIANRSSPNHAKRQA
jgi:hypothetical protein